MSSTVAPTAASPSAAFRRRNDAWPHRVLLGLALGVVVLSMVLSLGDEPGQVLVPLLNRPLPPLCQLKMLTGLDCPGCGLTRSFIAMGHAQWRDALRFNPAGPLWFILIAGQIP